MKIKDLKINFRYLGGNIACLSVDSISGESVHNDINNEEAIIIFNSLVGEKEDCQTVKSLLKENAELKEQLDKYENPEDMTLFAMWCTEKVKEENERLSEQLELLTSKLDEYDLITDERNQLKKQLEETDRKLFFTKNELDMRQKSIDNKLNQQKEFIKYLEDKIYSIEPKGTGINYNCEYDSEEDYVMAMQEQSRLNTLKEILQKYKSIIGDDK